MKIGLIGCGAIGTMLAEAIDDGQAGDAELVSVFDIDPARIAALTRRLNSRPKRFLEFEQFLEESDVGIVVEAASQEAVKRYIERVIEAGVDVMVMSVGALLDEELRRRIEAAAEAGRRRVIVPSGAIGGIDVVKAARLGGLDRVTLTTRKTPGSLRYSPYFQKTVKRPGDLRAAAVIFEGAARDAVKIFPASVNVAAVLSLAGLGGAETIVRIVADPSVSRNIHEIEAEGAFGRMTIHLENITHPSNPKTSYLAVLSAIETLRSLTSREIRIGT